MDDELGLCGTTIGGKYRVERLVGEGGFGVVYRAVQLELDRPVALKVLRADRFVRAAREHFLEKFRAEGKLIAKLAAEHEAIVQIYDLGQCRPPALGVELPYLALEWLEGEDLGAVLDARRRRGEGPMSEREAIDLMRPAIEAVAAAHAARPPIAHRDLKPANLYLARSRGKTTLRVLDFGIAKSVDEGVAAAVRAGTATALRAFTWRYGAPEQFSRKKYGETGLPTDVYALGLILIELVTGRLALDGDEDFGELMAATTSPKRPPPRGLGAAVSDGFEAVCARALAVEQADRYQNAGELLAALDAHGEAARREPAATPPPAPTVLQTPLSVDKGGTQMAPAEEQARIAQAAAPEVQRAEAMPGGRAAPKRDATPRAEAKVAVPATPRRAASPTKMPVARAAGARARTWIELHPVLALAAIGVLAAHRARAPPARPPPPRPAPWPPPRPCLRPCPRPAPSPRISSRSRSGTRTSRSP